VRRADRHVDYADFVLDLPHHDACFARVRRHPVQHSGRRAHGIGAIKFHARCRPAHGHGDIAAQDRVAVLRLEKWVWESREMRGGVIIAGPRNRDVFRHYCLALLLKLFPQDFFERREADTHHVETSADCQGVLCHFISRNVRQLGNRKWTKLHAIGGRARLDRVRVIDTRRARCEQLQVPVHGVLVQGNEQIDPVTHVGDLFRARSNRQ